MVWEKEWKLEKSCGLRSEGETIGIVVYIWENLKIQDDVNSGECMTVNLFKTPSNGKISGPFLQSPIARKELLWRDWNNTSATKILSHNSLCLQGGLA